MEVTGSPPEATRSQVPIGIYLIWKLYRRDFGLHEYRVTILVLTFVGYACFHASRKPLSIVKSVLDPDPYKGSKLHRDISGAPSPSSTVPSPGWPPFDGAQGAARLGEIDVAFLASYAVGMYFAGRLGDRLDLRKFLSFGMLSSGSFVCLFGLGYWWNIHSFEYYFVVQIITGLLSATGWPAVVAIVGNWFGKTKRGLIMGIWNAHASVGNIVGSIVASAALKYGWGWSFVIPAVAIMICGVLLFLFLVADPSYLGLPSPHESNCQGMAANDEDETEVLLTEINGSSTVMHTNDSVQHEDLEIIDLNSKTSQVIKGKTQREVHLTATDESSAVGFYEAWRIPGVAQYAFCLFFVKLVAYTFLYWLPFYIKHTAIAGRHVSDKMAGYLSTIFDIGGVIGGIIAGHLSDRFSVNAIIAVTFVGTAIPTLFIFRTFGSTSLLNALVLMTISGVFVNGPYALITTAVSADLGTHSSIKGNSRALATVTAIIDGTGSIGAAIGPFITGYIAVKSWNAVFFMLALSSLIAGLCLTKLVIAEISEKVRLYRGVTVPAFHQEELQEQQFN